MVATDSPAGPSGFHAHAGSPEHPFRSRAPATLAPPRTRDRDLVTPPATSPTDTSELWSPPPLSPRAERIAAAIITVVAVATVAWLTRRNWFHVDVWDPLTTREIGSFDDLMRPRNGHWAVAQVVQTRTLYGIAGMDFFPLHQMPRLIGWPIVAGAAWLLMRRRGADPYVALAAYAVLLVLGTSWFLQSWFVGMFVVALCLYGVAWLVDAESNPPLRAQIGMFLLLVAGLMSAGTMVGVLGGTMLVIVLARAWRWIGPVAAAAAVYGAWFLWYDVANAEGIDVGPSRLLEIPLGVAQVFAAALPKVLGLPPASAPVLAVGLVGSLVWLAYRRRLTRFDAIVMASVAVFLALVVIRRGVNLHDRYSNDTLVWLAPALVPLIRIPPRRWAWLVGAGVAGLVLVANVSRLAGGIGDLMPEVDDSRHIVETAAAIVADGEPFVAAASIDRVFARPLDADGLRRLVGDGWRPVPDPDRIEQARGRLRAAFVAEPAVTGGAFRADRVDDEGCVRLRGGDEVVMLVTTSGALTVDGPGWRRIDVTWRDAYGRGHYVSDRRPPATRSLVVAAPDGGELRLTLLGDGRPIDFCGLSR